MNKFRHPLVLWGGVLLLLVVMTRLPFIGAGFGGDPDAWRVAWSARHLAETGVYVPSRPPGYPLPEYFAGLMATLGWSGPVPLSLPSVILSALASLLIFLLALPVGRKKAVAAAFLFAFTPVVFVGSLGSMDYMWGLAFFLASSLAMTYANWKLSAILLGLAAASRPTYALGFLPLGLMLVDFDFRRLARWTDFSQVSFFALMSGAIAVFFYIPLFLHYGVSGLVRPHEKPSPVLILFNGSIGVFGFGFFVLFGVLLWDYIRKNKSNPAEWAGEQFLKMRNRRLLGVGLILIYVPLFVLLPDESAYLIPAVVGFYLLLSQYLRLPVLAFLVAVMSLSSFVGLITHDDHDKLTVIWRGPVLQDIAIQQRRRCMTSVVETFLKSASAQDMIVVAENRPEMSMLIGEPYVNRLVYTVKQLSDGRLADTEGDNVLPLNARFNMIDRAERMQAQNMPVSNLGGVVIPTRNQCR